MEANFLFLGSGGSMGVPVIGCTCSVCTSVSSFNKRLRPSGLIRASLGSYLIDAGPDFRQQALKFKIENLRGVLLTHCHVDHIGGLDDLRALYFLQKKKKIPCLVSKESFEELSFRYHYLMHIFEFQVLENDFGKTVFEGIEVAYVSYFQAGMKVNGYKIGDLAYISDIRDYTEEEVMAPLMGVNTLVISAVRTDPTHVHFGIEEATTFSRKLGAKKTYFTHIAHELDYEKTNALLPSDIKLSFDGLQIPIKI